MGRTIFGMPPAKEVFAARVAATDVPMNLRRFMRDLLDRKFTVDRLQSTVKRIEEKPQELMGNRPAVQSVTHAKAYATLARSPVLSKTIEERTERVYPSKY